jgi:hypothetical protein
VRYTHPRTWAWLGIGFLTVFIAAWNAAPCAGQYDTPNNQPGFNPAWQTPVPGHNYQPLVKQPTAPSNGSTPSAWPSGAPAGGPGQPTALGQLPPTASLTPCDGARILAHVGTEVVIEGDLLGNVNDTLEVNKEQIPADQYDAVRESLIKKELKNLIQSKLVYLDARRAIPAEAWPKIEKELERVFEERELGNLMKRMKVGSRHELDQKLRAMGTSLERQKHAFAERELVGEWVRQQIKHTEEVTYDQMLTYYHQHQAEFTTPARVKWEELMADTAKRTSQAAYQSVAQMGNQVLTGAALAEVAKANSDGVTAADGGQWDWTSQGALAAKEIDQALFSLPVGQLSPIIKTDRGFHIVRVTHREAVVIKPFPDAQADIREKIVKERSQKRLREYLAKVESRTPVTTVFDHETGSERRELSRYPQEIMR